MSFDFEHLSLNEMIRLQNELAATLSRRFERFIAIVFSDISGSTNYFSRFGNQAGRRLLQRHSDTWEEVIASFHGRIVDTAGDGVFLAFPQVSDAVQASIRFQEVGARQNAQFGQEHHLTTRTGVHWGKALTDSQNVVGEAVNLCSHLAKTAELGEIRLTKSVFMELSKADRLRCQPVGPVQLHGIEQPVDAFRLQWRDIQRFPTVVRVEETGQIQKLPDKVLITFGRLREWNGVNANDIPLSLGDSQLDQQISRWHFELHRRQDNLVIRAVSRQPTEVDGRKIDQGEEAPVSSGTLVRVSGVLTLRFLPGEPTASTDDTVTLKLHK
jgi:class 3 adenylate cyclase